jgi:hypothetical protein
MGPNHYLEGLATLHRIDDPDERRSIFRQSFATLASAVTSARQPVPLEGLSPDRLLESIEAAQSAGLLASLDWLSPPAAAAALYELAAALPPSEIKREIGRRVLERLQRGDASTFVALATRLALGSRRALSGPSVRARVALCLDLPIGSGDRADTLALALISRRELSREWLTIPSTGSLPSRRLAARLLERAAREAARRAAEGDDGGLRVFGTRPVEEAWQRLLADREPLVWRHVASARGLLSTVVPRFGEELRDHLDTRHSITEWRRAAASLAASIAVAGRGAVDACQALLESPLMERDRGIAGAMVFGLPRAAESDPAAVDDLLEAAVRVGGVEAAEALVELRRERIHDELGIWAAQHARVSLREALTALGGRDDGQAALLEAL